MELDDRALPLTRGQLGIWLAQETGHSGAEWQLGLFVRIEDTVERDPLERAIRTQLPGRLRRVYSHGQLTLHRPIGIGVITTSNTRHSDRAANGRRRLGSIRRSQQAIEFKHAYGTTG
jgi:hypothetical protein